jgi:hypothetical protein
VFYPDFDLPSPHVAVSLFWSGRFSAASANVFCQGQAPELGNIRGYLLAFDSWMRFGLCFVHAYRSAFLETEFADQAHDGGCGLIFRRDNLLSRRGALEEISQVSGGREAPNWRCRAFHRSGNAHANGRFFANSWCAADPGKSGSASFFGKCAVWSSDGDFRGSDVYVRKYANRPLSLFMAGRWVCFFAALGIVSCIIPEILVSPLSVVVGVLNLLGGIIALLKMWSQCSRQPDEPRKPVPPVLARLFTTQLTMNLLAIMFGISILVPGLVHGLVIGVILAANGCVLLYLLRILVLLDKMRADVKSATLCRWPIRMYSATKSALISLTGSLGYEFWDEHIRLSTVIFPGQSPLPTGIKQEGLLNLQYRRKSPLAEFSRDWRKTGEFL